MQDVSRRALAKGAAWAIPPIVLVAASPLASASVHTGDKVAVQSVSLEPATNQKLPASFVVKGISGLGSGDTRTVTVTVTVTVYEDGAAVSDPPKFDDQTFSLNGGSHSYTFIYKGKNKHKYYFTVVAIAVLNTGGQLTSPLGTSDTVTA